ncbi:CobW C-terminal domain-containing protein [Gimesia aquarii]|uniref:GTP-binding protein n=1 Tax=Gimesia aquarii TaxID=2527964 RepID=UPI0011A0F78E|nr:GTP-binding protein [Gimesia aquarii]
MDAEHAREILLKYEGHYGDCRQELVFIGTKMDETEIRKVLNQCLLQDLEWIQGPDVWSTYTDPFQINE